MFMSDISTRAAFSKLQQPCYITLHAVVEPYRYYLVGHDSRPALWHHWWIGTQTLENAAEDVAASIRGGMAVAVH